MTTWTNEYGQITTDNLLQDKWLHGQMTTWTNDYMLQ